MEWLKSSNGISDPNDACGFYVTFCRSRDYSVCVIKATIPPKCGFRYE